MIFFVASATSISYKVSLDKTEISFSGENEELTQVDTQKPGAYTQFKVVIVNSSIIGLGDLCFSGFIGMISISIPSTCKYFKEDALGGCTSLKSITLPDGFEDLGKGSFYSCTSLSQITFPSTFNCLRSTARTFQFCNSLQKFVVDKNNKYFSTLNDGKILVENQTVMVSVAGSFPEIIIPAQIEIISEHTFSGRDTVTSITFQKGSNLSHIGAAAFRYSSISNMTLPNGVKTLMNSLWEYITPFTEVSFPSTLEYVHPDVFAGAENLEIVKCNPCQGIIIDSNNIIYNQDNTVIFVPANTDFFNITLNTTIIPAQAIQTKRNLKNITVAENHTEYYALQNLLYLAKTKALYACPGGIEVAVIDSECTAISNYAFKSTIVKNVTFLGSKVLTIGKQAFYKAASLTYINLPDSITSILAVGFHTTGFSGQTVVLPANLGTLGAEAFRSCSALRINMSRCTKLTAIQDDTFRTMKFLQSIILPPNLETLGTNSFLSCQNLLSVELPRGLSAVPLYAFQSCRSLQNVTFEAVSRCTKIQAAAFKGCDLRSLSLPDSVELIEAEAFNGNSNLRTLELTPASNLTEIRANAVQNCAALEEINFGAKLRTFAPGALAFSPGLKRLTVSDSNPHFAARDNVLYTKNTTVVVACPGGLERATIEGNVTMFGDSAFYGCSRLVSIDFESVPLAAISASAFYGCTSLQSIEIPASVSSLSENAFNGCGELSHVVFNSGSRLLSLGSAAFSGCKKLRSVTFEGSASLIEVCPSAFANCETLEAFTFPESVETIGAHSFEGCLKLSAIRFTDSSNLTTIGTAAFKSCSSVERVTLPASLSSLGPSAFNQCGSLKIVEYCGAYDLSGTNAFLNSPQAHAYASLSYPYETVGGLRPFKVLDGDCLMPTGAFTPESSKLGAAVSALMFPCVINDDDN